MKPAPERPPSFVTGLVRMFAGAFLSVARRALPSFPTFERRWREADSRAPRRSFIVGGAILTIIVGIVLLVRALFPSAPGVDRAPLDQLGQLAAEQAVRLVGDTGKVVIWRLANNRSNMPGPLTTLRSFDTQVRKTSRLHVVAQEQSAHDFSDVISPEVVALPGSEFVALLEKYHDADALVLLGTAPVLEDADYARLPNPRPKVLALCLVNHMPTRRLFAEHVLDVAIMPRMIPAEAANNFVVVTVENAATLLR